MNGGRQFDAKRLAALILFFADECADDRYFGATKLNKLLFTADFWAYGYLGQSITGSTYVHQEHGPTPEPRLFLSTRDELVDSGCLKIVTEGTYKGIRKRPVAEVEPDLSLFTEDELSICKDAIEHLCSMTAHESREWSHSFLGWRYTGNGDVIPYYTAFLWHENLVTRSDILWGMRMAEELGLERETTRWGVDTMSRARIASYA